MKPGYKIQRDKIKETDNCILVLNDHEGNIYAEFPTEMQDVFQKIHPFDIGAWIPKNPDGTSKKRPDNWPNKNTKY